MRHVHYLVHYLLVLEYRFYQPKHEIFRLREALVYILTTLLRTFVTCRVPYFVVCWPDRRLARASCFALVTK